MPQPLLCNQPENADHAQLYEILVDELTDFVVFLMDPTGCIVSWNPGVERILGYSEAEWLGQSTEIIFIPEDRVRDVPADEMEKAAREGRAPDIRWHVRKNGTRLYVEGTLVALREESGQLLGFSKVMRDITERKRRELALQDAVRYAESIVDAVREPLLVLDSALRVQSANRSFYNQFQVSPEETQGQFIYRLGDGQWNVSLLQALLEEVLTQNKAIEGLEMEVGFPSIGRKVLSLNARKLWQEGNHTKLILLAIEDITESKQATTQQAALLELGDRLRDLRQPADMAGVAAELLGRTLGVVRAGYGTVDAAEQMITIERDWTNGQVKPAIGSYRFADYGASLADNLKRGETVVISDVAKDARTADGAERFAALGIRALLDIPLLSGGRLAGALHLHDSVPRAWSREEIRFARKVLDRTWAAMERARSEQRLQQSERRLQATQDQAGVGIQEVDAEGNYLSINEGFTRLSGYTIADFAGRTYFDFIEDGEEQQRARENFAHLVQGEIDAYSDSRLYTSKVGRRWWAEMRTTAVRDEAGRFLYAVRIVADVTERKRLEAALRASEERLQQIFAQAPVAIAVFRGRDFVVELANPAYQDLLRGRELTGRRFADAAPELGADVWDAFHRVLDTGEPFTAQEWFISYDQNGDGVAEDHWFNVMGHPLRASDGSISGLVAVLSEVTAQVRARQELERANRELEEFVYIASHDLQEPLRMVNIYSQLLLRQFAGEDQNTKQYAGFIQQGVSRMETLIRDFLAFSRTVQKEDQPTGAASLSDALAEALSILQSRIEETGATITAETLPTVRGNTGQLSLIFQNLLSNSIKYCQTDVRPEIHISAEQRNSEWIISVRDNGIGFEPQYAERIFGLFKRLHRDEYPGTGLGLAICQRIIERYGGRIWAQSNLGEGATFSFALPRVEE